MTAGRIYCFATEVRTFGKLKLYKPKSHTMNIKPENHKELEYLSPSLEEMEVRLDHSVATSLAGNGIEDLYYDPIEDWN